MLTLVERRALLELMGRVILEARSQAWSCHRLPERLSGKREAKIAALMDLIHNIPPFLLDGDGWNAAIFLDYLDSFDREWDGGMRAHDERLLAEAP